MRFKPARKLSEAFKDLDVDVNVEYTDNDTKVKVIARKQWFGIVLVPTSELTGNDDEQADILMRAAEKAVKIVENKSNG
jgi:organic hydroperoxide reductase OsmC/OhrA